MQRLASQILLNKSIFVLECDVETALCVIPLMSTRLVEMIALGAVTPFGQAD